MELFESAKSPPLINLLFSKVSIPKSNPAEEVDDENEICKKTAQFIANGKIVGWFHGRMEWGPRALGNRSILVDPRRSEMRDVLNARVKRREPFRPFAPSILLERVGEYFEKDYPVPAALSTPESS